MQNIVSKFADSIMKTIKSLSIILGLAVCQMAAAQSLLPPTPRTGTGTVKAGGAASAVQPASGSVSKAVYNVAPASGASSAASRRASVSASASSSSRQAGPVRLSASSVKVSVPRPDREMPSPRIAASYDTKVRTNVHFHVNRTNLDMAYLDNRETLDDFVHLIDSVGAMNVKSVEVVSKASPEGDVDHNNELARGRADAVCNFIDSEYPALSSKVAVNADGESWDELRRYISRDVNITPATRNALLRIIDSEPDLTRRKDAIKRVEDDPSVGGVYRYLLQNYYVLIRNTAIYVEL